jgi:hypothetical protein
VLPFFHTAWQVGGARRRRSDRRVDQMRARTRQGRSGRGAHHIGISTPIMCSCSKLNHAIGELENRHRERVRVAEMRADTSRSTSGCGSNL